MLTPRQQLILNAIVEGYVYSAEPVGSRALSKNAAINLSPATIRNEMADLEEMGYLAQPHTSAGRVPSQKGYRFYVDNLNAKVDMDGQAVQALRQLFRQKMVQVEEVIQQTSTVLSELTQYTAIVLGPRIYQEKIKQIQFIPLSARKAVAILVTDAGHVENCQVQLSEEVSAEDIEQMVRLLNTKLAGTPLHRMKSHMYREISDEMVRTLEHYEDALEVLDSLCDIASHGEERVYIGGSANMLAQPEFRDVEKVRPLLQLLEDTGFIQQVIPIGTSGVHVRIGQENHMPSLQDCTVISATYTLDGKPAGSLGILGPTRMNYARVMKILDYVANGLTHVINERMRSS